MTQSRIFKSGKMQAVRLPKAVAFPEQVTRVKIIRRGNTRVITPAGGTWEDFFASPPIDKDFLSDRRQPSPHLRNVKR
jgi:antitoxin VapB